MIEDTKISPNKKSYNKDGNLEAHMIIDILHIENITAELKEFRKVTNNKFDKLEDSFTSRIDKAEDSFTIRLDKLEDSFTSRFDKLEGWIIGIVATSFVTLSAILIAIITEFGA